MILDSFTTPHFCNVYFFGVDKDHMVIIDPGENYQGSLINFIKKKKYNIRKILLTHAHFDHIYALSDIQNVFPDAPILIYHLEVPALSDPYLNLSANLDYGLPLLDHKFPNVVPIYDETIDCMGIPVQVIPMNFHTAGGVSYYLKDEKILFSGDNVFYHSIGKPIDFKAIIPSLDKLKDLPDDITIYPGHGEKTTLGEERAYYPQLFKRA